MFKISITDTCAWVCCGFRGNCVSMNFRFRGHFTQDESCGFGRRFRPANNTSEFGDLKASRMEETNFRIVVARVTPIR